MRMVPLGETLGIPACDTVAAKQRWAASMMARISAVSVTLIFASVLAAQPLATQPPAAAAPGGAGYGSPAAARNRSVAYGRRMDGRAGGDPGPPHPPRTPSSRPPVGPGAARVGREPGPAGTLAATCSRE